MFWPCQNKHIKEVNRTEGTVTKAYVNSSRASRPWAWWKKDYGSCRLHLWRAVWHRAGGYWAPMARSGIYQVASLKWRPSSTFIWECDKKRIGFAAGLGNPPTALRNKTIRQILNENNSPYFHSVSLVIWPFTLMKSTHYIRKAKAWTLHFRTPNPRREKCQCKIVSLKHSYMSRSFATHLLYLAWPRCFRNRVSTLVFLTDW